MIYILAALSRLNSVLLCFNAESEIYMVIRLTLDE